MQVEVERIHREEAINALTHGLGALASIAGGIAVITAAARFGDLWQLAGQRYGSPGCAFWITAPSIS